LAQGLDTHRRPGSGTNLSFDVYDALPDPDNYRQRRIAVSMSLYNQKGPRRLKPAR
jgi:hypothetical protein